MKKVFLRNDTKKKIIFDRKTLTKEIREVFVYPHKQYKLTERQFNYHLLLCKRDKNFKDISLKVFLRKLFRGE